MCNLCVCMYIYIYIYIYISAALISASRVLVLDFQRSRDSTAMFSTLGSATGKFAKAWISAFMGR